MPERSSKWKARRDSPTTSIDEPEATSLRTENAPSISDWDFSERTLKKLINLLVEGLKDIETGQREILKMIENLSPKIDSLFGKTPNTVTLEMNETNPQSLIPTSRPIEVNEFLRDENQNMVTGVIIILIPGAQACRLQNRGTQMI